MEKMLNGSYFDVAFLVIYKQPCEQSIKIISFVIFFN